MDKLKVIKVIGFVGEDAAKFGTNSGYNIQPTGALELYLPIAAISHLVQVDMGNPKSHYDAYINKNYPLDLPFSIMSFNPVHLSSEQVELL